MTQTELKHADGGFIAKSALASASAGFLTRLSFHPFDTVRAQVQTNGGRTFFLPTMWNLAKNNFTQLYRGLTFTLAASIPAQALYLTSYEISKRWLRSVPFLSNSDAFCVLTSGFLAETVSCVLWVPIDVVKQRMQVHSSTDVRDVTHLFRLTVRNEGFLGLYKGFGMTLFSFGPYSAFMFMFYENLKKMRPPQRKSTYLLYSATSAGLAGLLTSPLDVVKTRVQVQMEGLDAMKYKGFLDCFAKTWQSEGFRGFFRGVGARIAFCAPSAAVFMTCYENFMQKLA